MNQENPKEEKIIRELFKIWAEGEDKRAQENGLDKRIMERCQALRKLMQEIAPYETESCLDRGQARDYLDNEPAVLKQFGDHVAKCPDYCQKLVAFYKK